MPGPIPCLSVGRNWKCFFFLIGWFFFNSSYSKDLSEFQTYQVKSGENYYVIGKKFNINYPELIRLNKKKKLYAGTEIKIPDFFHYKVRKNDHYYALAKKFNISFKWLHSLNKKKKLLIGDWIKIPRETPLKVALKEQLKDQPKKEEQSKESLRPHPKKSEALKSPKNETQKIRENIKKISKHLTFVWPVNGKIEQNFGVHEDILNQGILLKLDPSKKKLVYASEMGKVVFVDNIRGFGKTMILSHGKEIFSAYMGIAKNKKSLNQSIKKGDPIALGHNKVFFSIFIKGTPEDPLWLLENSL